MTVGRADGRAALAWQEREYAALEAQLGPVHRDTLRALERLADRLLALGEQAAALASYQRGHTLAEVVLGADDVDTLSLANGLVECLLEQDRAAEALALCRPLVEQRRRVLGEADLATLTSLNNLAVCYGNLGRADESLPLLKRVLDARLARPDVAEAALMRSLSNYGAALARLGRLQEALPWLERSVGIAERIHGPEDRMLCEPLNLLGYCLLPLLRIDEALRCHDRAIAISEAHVGRDHFQTLMYLQNRASCLASLQRWDEAVDTYREQVQRCRNSYGDDSSLALLGRSNLAYCLARTGRGDEALQTWQAVRDGQTRALGRSHPFTLLTSTRIARLLDDQGPPEAAARAWLGLVDDLLQRPNPQEAWTGTASATALALAAHAGRSELFDWDAQMGRLADAVTQCLDLTSPEQLARSRGVARLLFDLHLRLCLEHDRPAAIPRVLALRQGRRLAALVLEELDAQTTPTEPGSLRTRLQALRIELRRLSLSLQATDDALAQPRAGPADRATRDTLGTRQHELAQAYAARLGEYEALREELARSDAGLAVPARALAVSLPPLQARLAPGEALLLLFERDEPAQCHALLIGASTAVLVRLGDDALAQAGTLSTHWGRALHTRAGLRRGVVLASEAAPRAGEVPEAAPLERLAALLHAGLWSPLATQLAGLQRLHVVTHGSFHLLPLALGAPADLALSLYPGFVYYHRLRHQDSPPADAPRAAGTLGLAVHAADDVPGFDAIPLVRAEAQIVRSLWPGAVHADPDLAQAEPPLSTLQLAGHGQVDAREPARANLLLAGGALDLHAVLEARQHPAVVVLSACTVGRTADDPDGEPLGLVGGFLLRGARTVIASLQPVPDFHMPLLMALFYRGWCDGLAPAQALADAKRRLASGDWHADTAALIRRHYPAALAAGLHHALRAPRPLEMLALLSHAWPLPAPWRQLHADRDAAALAQLRRQLDDDPGRQRLAEAIVQGLIDERAQLPRHQVETLCTWVQAFGDAG